MEQAILALFREWKVIGQAPFTFVVVLLGLFGAAYATARWRYAGKIEHLEERLRLRDDKIKALEERDPALKKSPDPKRVAPKAQSPILGSSVSSPILPTAGVVSEKIFLGKSVTRETFKNLYADRTDLQGARLSEAYLGKWIKVRGTFENAKKRLGESYTLDFKGEPMDHYISVIMDGKFLAKIEAIQPGERICIEGCIDHIDRRHTWLKECSFLPLTDADDAIEMSPPVVKPRRISKRTRKS